MQSKLFFKSGRRIVSFAAFLPLLILVIPLLAIAFSLTADLNGWWKVVEDNGHIIKIIQENSNVTVWDSDGTLLASGILSNDTVFIFFSPTDTLFFIYANDTLSGLNEEGNPITLVRFPVDLNGFWDMLQGDGFLAMQHQGSDVTIWLIENPWSMDSTYIGEGAFGNDTLLMFFTEPMPDTLTFIYAFDTLRGFDPFGDSITLVRAPDNLWSPIRCGTIAIGDDTDDWLPEYIMADDFDNDGTGDPSQELDKIYMCYDSAYLYVRLDCVGDADLFYGSRYTISIGKHYHQQPDYSIYFDNSGHIGFRNNITGQETTLEAPGWYGHTMEGRIPMNLLEYFQKADIRACSEYYDWYNGWSCYDEIEFLAERRPCGDGRSLFLPEPQYAIFGHTINPFIDTIIIGDLQSRNVADIDPASVLVNGAIQPLAVSILPGYQGFTGEVMQVLLSAAQFVGYYEPIWGSRPRPYTVTGQYTDDENFVIAWEVFFIGHRSGDANGDGLVNLSDISMLVNYLYMDGPAPARYSLCNSDPNKDCICNIFDITYLVSYLYLNGPEPCDCEDWINTCGTP